ncbi:MAG: ABC transporter permease [Victivallaceae bacterium]|nr:ABC transporter permease [Victivallaceae bacterium]
MNVKRLHALIVKERKQLLRDPFNLAVGILLPLMLLMIFGYGMSVDVKNIKLAIVEPEPSEVSSEIVAGFNSSKFFRTTVFRNTAEALRAVKDHRADACLFLPQYLPKKVVSGDIPFMVAANATNPSQAMLKENYIKSVIRATLAEQLPDGALGNDVAIRPRMWFNEANDSRYFMIPGVIVIIMSMIGTMLTTMLMAKEYEHGNLESMFVTPMTSLEILIAKAVNNFVLGMIGLAISLAAARWLFEVPIMASLWVVLLGCGIFLVMALCLGLLISSITKNQFVASEMTMVLTFMPAFLLSGFLYEIENQPVFIQYLTYIVPARYFVDFLQTAFLVGNVWPAIAKDLIVLSGFALLLLVLAIKKNPKSLEG